MNDCIQTRILVAEDDSLYRHAVARLIGKNGYASLEAANGKDALRIFRRDNPALVLTDLRMPVMDGFELLAKVNAESPATPVIVFSGLGGNSDIIHAFRSGAVDYIEKPVSDTRQLLDRIERALARIRGGSEGRPGESKVNPGKYSWSGVVDALTEPVALVDTRHRLLRMNRAMAEILGNSKGELFGSVHYLSTDGFGNRKQARRDIMLLKHHESASGRFFDDKSGAFYEVKMTPFYKPDGFSLAGCVYIARDISSF